MNLENMSDVELYDLESQIRFEFWVRKAIKYGPKACAAKHIIQEARRRILENPEDYVDNFLGIE